MQFNWVDILIIGVIVYALADGWRRGLLALLANLVSFLASLWLAVRFHGVVGDFMGTTFGLTDTWTTVLGYIVVGMTSQLIIETITLTVLSKLPTDLSRSTINAWIGSVVSFLNAMIILAFMFLLVLALPLRGTIRQDVRSSQLARQLIRLAENYGGQVRSSLEDFARDATKFLTVEPGSLQSITLDIPQGWSQLSVSSANEQAMVDLVNKERVSRGLTELRTNSELVALAREKSRDMFERRYFSHYDPDGKDASDRADAAGITYGIIGENLAYAPDFSTAHQGLMDSQGHRENILEARYHQIGIGVIDGGIYGKMFTQIFTD